ncbi:MAG: hypothetical protein L3J57_11735 [Desulfuromusa sp.]|nr:hypothetical protein [Desulfuromusa sp.]
MLPKAAKSVSVVKRKKIVLFVQVMGSSGNLRAPTYRTEDDFVLGFDVDLFTGC